MAAKVLERNRVRLRKNDLVEVVAGKDKGKRGKVLQVIRDKNRVVVQGVNFIKRHTRPNPQRNIKGGIAEREAPLAVSNVMLVDPENEKLTRVGSRTLADGRKVRVAKSGAVLDK
jgi:large subunit ribosomal protein L24